MKTSEKYFNAICALEAEIKKTGGQFSMSKFCRERNLSNSFGAACIDSGIITMQRDYRDRPRYIWGVAGAYTESLGDIVRTVLSIRTNGNRPKIDRESVMSKKPGTHPRKRRKSSENPSGLISDGVQRPEFLYNGTGDGISVPELQSIAKKVDQGETDTFDQVAKGLEDLTKTITRHPGHIDGEKIIKRVQSSLFRKLCPQCAETLHQIIDLLKS